LRFVRSPPQSVPVTHLDGAILEGIQPTNVVQFDPQVIVPKVIVPKVIVPKVIVPKA
jgi:hypothetical protein